MSGKVQSINSGTWKDKKFKKSKSDRNGGWYLTFSLGHSHKRVHHAVWETFVGPRQKGLVINHIDGNRENNALSNLEEVTQKDNVANMIARGTYRGGRKKKDEGALQ